MTDKLKPALTGGRWNAAIRNFNNRIQVAMANRAEDELVGDAIEKSLRERLIPFLEAVNDMRSFMLDCPQKTKFREEFDKWLTK